MSVTPSNLEVEIAQAAAKVIDAAYPKPASRKTPATLWHYTSNASLLKILESRSVWATHVSCVNDSTEAAHLFDLIFQRLQKWRTKPGAAPIINHIKGARGKDYCTTSHWFISSYCADGDDLNLWRAYTDHEGGVAIGFDPNQLRQPTTHLLPVLYTPKKQKMLVSELLNSIETCFCAHKAQGLISNYRHYWNLWEEQISILAPLVKHKAFKAEREWRLITQLGSQPLSDLKYLTRRTTITRHLPLKFGPGGQNGTSLISEIKIGPGQHQIITKTSIEALLNSKGYTGVKVTLSSIPFRSF